VREPGRTADPSATLGMTKGRIVTFIRGRQIGWTEKKQSLHFASVPRHAGTGGMTKGRIVTFIRGWTERNSHSTSTARWDRQDDDSVGV
jgi:hypothetical protein